MKSVDLEVEKKVDEEARAEPQQGELPKDDPPPDLFAKEVDLGVSHEESTPMTI